MIMFKKRQKELARLAAEKAQEELVYKQHHAIDRRYHVETTRDDIHTVFAQTYQQEINDIRISLILRRFKYSSTWQDLTPEELSKKPDLVNQLWKLMDDSEEFEELHQPVRVLSR